MTRRDLAAALLTPQVLAALQHAHDSAADPAKARLTYLDTSSAAEIEALAAQIMPSDGTPGAKEAGVIYFIDRALSTFDRDKQQAYSDGMASVQAKRKELYPRSASVAALAEADAIALVRAIEKTEFFDLLRVHTVMGFFGNPSYGGNRNQAGWKLIGFEDRHAFHRPFGYYDDPKNGGPAL